MPLRHPPLARSGRVPCRRDLGAGARRAPTFNSRQELHRVYPIGFASFDKVGAPAPVPFGTASSKQVSPTNDQPPSRDAHLPNTNPLPLVPTQHPSWIGSRGAQSWNRAGPDGR